MNAGGDAAEQIVRMSLEGVEVAARITGSGAKNLAVLIAAVLKEEQKTHGKARLSNMIRSGNELKVFTVQQKDLKRFAKEAKRYGVLYSVLREKGSGSPDAAIDVIARSPSSAMILIRRVRMVVLALLPTQCTFLQPLITSLWRSLWRGLLQGEWRTNMHLVPCSLVVSIRSQGPI